MKICVTEKQLDLIVSNQTEFVEQEDGTETGTGDASGGGTSGAGETFEIVAGSNSNEIILVNPFGSTIVDARIAVTVSEFGIATFDWQDAFQTSEVCCAGYTQTQIRTIPSATSLALACTGYLEIKFNTRLGLAGGSPSGYSFGDGFFKAQKN